MISRWLVLVACAVLTGSLPAHAQAPTPEQLELLRSMSPEDREALMSQLGLGGLTGGDTGSVGTSDTGRSGRNARQAGDRLPGTGAGELVFQPVDKTLTAEDSVLIDIDFKKGKPARVESPGPGLPTVTIPAEPPPEIEPLEKEELQKTLDSMRAMRRELEQSLH